MKIKPGFIPKGIRDLKVAIIGYGHLGRPVAQCLSDSGHEVHIGLRDDSQSLSEVKSVGFTSGSISEVTSWADAIFLLIPDDRQGPVFKEHVKNNLQPGSILVLAHGYAFYYEQIVPPNNVDAVVIAPHGPGKALREYFLAGSGLAGQIAIHRNNTGAAETRGLMLASSLGLDKGGIRLSSVREEVIVDHFAEQMVLCGGVVELMKAAFKTLIDYGFDSEIAYESVVRELKYTVDLIHQSGPSNLMDSISNSALIGSLMHGNEAVGKDVNERMRSVMKEIERGNFKRNYEQIVAGVGNVDLKKEKKSFTSVFRDVEYIADLPKQEKTVWVIPEENRGKWWRNIGNIEDMDVSRINEMEAKLDVILDETVHIRRMISQLKMCHCEAQQHVKIILESIGSGIAEMNDLREWGHVVASDRLRWQAVCDILQLWIRRISLEMAQVEKPDLVDDIQDFYLRLGDYTPLKAWQVEHLTNRILCFVDLDFHARMIDDESPDDEFRKLTDSQKIITAKKDDARTEFTLSQAIDGTTPCNWNFETNLRLILSAIGGKGDSSGILASHGINIEFNPIRKEMVKVILSLDDFVEDKATEGADVQIMSLLGKADPAKKWLAASLSKTIKAQIKI